MKRHRQVRVVLDLLVDDPIGVNVGDCIAGMLEGEIIANDGWYETEITEATYLEDASDAE